MENCSSILDPVPWSPKNRAFTRHLCDEVALLSRPEQVDDALQDLTGADAVVLSFVTERVISMLTPHGRYTLNLNYPAMVGLDLGKHSCRFVVLDSYAQAARLKALGIKRPVESVRLQEHLLGRSSFSNDKAGTERLLNSYMNNKKNLEQTCRMTTYDLMCKAQPYLSDLPGFHVDKAKFEDILAGWAAMENMAGTVTEWRKQLELYPDIMPVRLIPNGVFNGRYTAREPSILSMPSALRTAMNAAPGHTLVAVDFHQCQPRIIAEASGDPVFRAPFVNGTDYYKMWASFLLGKPEAEVTAEERKGCKLIALMWCFGMGDDKLGDEFERLGFSKEQALRGMRRFERACGRLKQWERSLIYDAQKRRGIWTVAAAPELRRFFSIPRGSAHNAMNYLATGTEVTIMLVAIIVLGRKLEELHPTARIALYLYDEVIVQCPVEEAEAVADLTQKALLWAFRQVLPHAPTSGLLDCRIAPNWGELKG